MIALILFWLAFYLMFHSYVIYPWYLQIAAGNKTRDILPLLPEAELPHLILLFSVYNGQRFIKRKIESIYKNFYPEEKLHVLVGSDCPDDDTDTILRALQQQYPSLKVFFYKERRGKVKVLNELMEEAARLNMPGSILLMTDVSAFFRPDCFVHLVKHFSKKEVGLVGANILKGAYREDGISFQEKMYYERELTMKYQEGLAWGVSMGAFGACYAIRQEQAVPIPDNFLVDDFFMTMQLMQKGSKAIYDMEAAVEMDIPNESAVEFRRKVRIAAGNFQNLKLFRPVLLQMNKLSFAFWSHKVIRWLGPFFILCAFICSLLLYREHWVYMLAVWVQTAFLLLPLLNFLLEKLQIHLKLLKFVAHFYLMNLGVLFGFIRFMKGIENNVWTPTQR